MKYERLKIEIVKFDNNLFMMNSFNNGHCDNYTAMGDGGVTHTCYSVDMVDGNYYRCSGYSYTGYCLHVESWFCSSVFICVNYGTNGNN